MIKKIIVTTVEMTASVAFFLLIMGSVDVVANFIAFAVLCAVWFVGEYIVDHKFTINVTKVEDNV